MVACYPLFSQTSEDLAALQEIIGNEHYQEIQSKGQERLALMAYMNRHGYYVSDVQGLKDISGHPDALEVQKKYSNAEDLNDGIFTNGELDLMAYSFRFHETDFTYYRIGNSTMLLVILPRQEVLKQMNSNSDAE